jgi:hypothetical protein
MQNAKDFDFFNILEFSSNISIAREISQTRLFKDVVDRTAAIVEGCNLRGELLESRVNEVIREVDEIAKKVEETTI